MKKHLLLTAALAISAAFSASALSASDLIGKKCGVVPTGTNIELFIGKMHTCSDVVAGSSSNQIIIKGFMGAFDLPLTVNSNGTLSWNLNQTYKGIGNFSSYTNIKVSARTLDGAVNKVEYPYNSYMTYYGEAYSLSNPTITSSTGKYLENQFATSYIFSNDDTNGFPEGFCVWLASNAFQYYGSFQLYFFDAEDTAVQYNNDNTTQTYKVGVTLFVDDNEPDYSILQINNLFNKGIMYANNLDLSKGYGECVETPVNAAVYADGTINMPPVEIGGAIHNTTAYYGKLDFYNGGWYTYGPAYWEIEGNLEWSHRYLCSAIDANSNMSSIKGKLMTKSTSHNIVNNNWWISNGGKTTTVADAQIVLDNVGYYDMREKSFTIYAKKIEIDCHQLDITHQVKFDEPNVSIAYKAKSVKQPEDRIYIQGSIDQSSIRNAQYVDKYELHIIPGKYTVVSGDEFNHENGHSKGLNISDRQEYWMGWYPTDIKTLATGDKDQATIEQEITDANSNGNFCRMVTETDFAKVGMTMDPDNNYTLYLKAIYTPESGLAPTFHALSAYSGGTTGVEDIVGDEEQGTISVNGTSVTINGSNGNALVVTPAGVVVYQGDDTTVELAPGLYIVRAGNTTQRILVK